MSKQFSCKISSVIDCMLCKVSWILRPPTPLKNNKVTSLDKRWIFISPTDPERHRKEVCGFLQMVSKILVYTYNKRMNFRTRLYFCFHIDSNTYQEMSRLLLFTLCSRNRWKVESFLFLSKWFIGSMRSPGHIGSYDRLNFFYHNSLP